MSGSATVTLTPADYVAANRLVMRTSRQHRLLPWIGLAALLVGASSITSDRLRDWTWHAALADAVVPLTMGAMLLVLPAIRRWRMPRSVANQFAQRLEMGAEMQVRWDDHAITFEATNGSSIQRWTTLHRRLLDMTSFVLLPTDGLMLLVTRSSLSAEAWSDLLATADRCGPRIG